MHKRWCGTEQWAAPEIMVDRKSPYYFSLDNDYHCRQCLNMSSSAFDPLIVTQNKMCGRCTDEIFKFYRKNDIYGIGLILWSILKAGETIVLALTGQLILQIHHPRVPGFSN